MTLKGHNKNTKWRAARVQVEMQPVALMSNEPIARPDRQSLLQGMRLNGIYGTDTIRPAQQFADCSRLKQ
jgi:hypothetical protein